MELCDGDERDVAQLEFPRNLDDRGRFPRERDDDEKVVLRQRRQHRIEFLASRDVVEKDVVVEEKALELRKTLACT